MALDKLNSALEEMANIQDYNYKIEN